jgi:hypothetical protein
MRNAAICGKLTRASAVACPRLEVSGCSGERDGQRRVLRIVESFSSCCDTNRNGRKTSSAAPGAPLRLSRTLHGFAGEGHWAIALRAIRI